MTATQTAKAVTNHGICATCKQVVPAHHETREGSVYLVKVCPDCGRNETRVSTDASRYEEKRAQIGYCGEAEKSCALNCKSCNAHKPPTLVFLDVTNRCNMNCPICLANIPAMGFRFDPPREYFERIFARLSQIEPKPKIQLFGGEPTCREDLVELIELARDRYGLEARVVTNGIRLADEEYCQRLLATGCQLMFSFDGRNPAIYERTRKHPRAYEKKLKALENVRKYRRKSKITLMVCVGSGVNDEDMADLVAYCHEGRDFIAAMDLIPLTATWGPEQVDAGNTTIEDVERIMAAQIPGTLFFPAATLYRLGALRQTFDLGRLTFGGAHPNCEAVSAMVSDGQQYHPIGRYLKRPLNDVIAELLALDQRMAEKLPRSLLGKLFGQKGRRFVYGWALLRLIRHSMDTGEVLGPHPKAKMAQIAWGLVRGIKLKHLLRQHTHIHSLLRVIILPFEEAGCVEAARLVDCPAQFAYEHPETREVRFMPVCAWTLYKNDILRVTAEHYGVDHETGQEGLTGLKRRTEVLPDAVATAAP
jgi:MoaA/NifB/PqqE/SkfB family radical SAM enzyme